MKNLLISGLLAIFTLLVLPAIFENNEAKAQLVTTLTPIAANDTLTTADTAWVYVTTNSINSKTFSSSGSVADNISRSVTAKITKVSGTVAGTFTFEGSTDGINWETIGSAYTITNTTGDQVKNFAMRSSGDLLFTYYRGVFLMSGGVSIPKLLYLRRSN